MMNPFDMYDALDGMVILVDTREQDTASLRRRLQSFGNYRREKLDFGDYTAEFPLPGGGIYTLKDKVAVERKMNLDELCQCYCQGRQRFEREFDRAKNASARIYLLIENASWEKAYSGAYRSKMRPTALIASMLAWMARYDAQIIMCDAKTSATLIKDILYREGKKRLEALPDADNIPSAI